jgi:RND family efflux transporter MFP subunit
MLAINPPGEAERRSAGEPDAIAQSRRGGRGLKVLAVCLAVALLVAFLFVRHLKSDAAITLADQTQSESKAPPMVDVVTAQPAPATWPLILPGETSAWYDSKIYARVNGYVAKWLVDIGDHVAKGQTLAVIETPELDADLAAAKAKLTASQAQVEVRQADADFAKSTDDRWRESPPGSVSQQERESKRAAYVAAVAQLAAARAQVQIDEAEVERLTTLTEFKEVKAPFAGTIVQRNIDIGNLVTAGSTASTSSLYRISLDDPIRVFVDVPQSAAAQLLSPGVEATVTTTGQPPREFHGSVARTSMSINARARTLKVEVDLPNADHGLVPGMYVRVGFQMKSRGVAELPAAGLTFRSNGPQVAVIGDDGRVRFRSVKIGSDDGSIVQIVDGLKAGEKVVLNLSSQIADGDAVRTNEVDTERSASASTAK